MRHSRPNPYNSYSHIHYFISWAHGNQWIHIYSVQCKSARDHLHIQALMTCLILRDHVENAKKQSKCNQTYRTSMMIMDCARSYEKCKHFIGQTCSLSSLIHQESLLKSSLCCLYELDFCILESLCVKELLTALKPLVWSWSSDQRSGGATQA